MCHAERGDAMRGGTNRVVIREDGAVDGDLHGIVRAIATESRAVALTGAGISVESGIPDFRSEGGLWSRFDPLEYATLSCFLRQPGKAWQLYRELGQTLAGRRPNPAHRALAELEREGRLLGVITQNVDGLHQAAGSRNVVELHGDHGQLQCLGCGRLEPLLGAHLKPGPPPECVHCGFPLKPNVVLFEEPVRQLGAAHRLIRGCGLLLVIGTSAEVAPASLLPQAVRDDGGSLVVFNLEPTLLADEELGPRGGLILGPVGTTLPSIARLVLGRDL
jgi:NAD-dependent deacetylase